MAKMLIIIVAVILAKWSQCFWPPGYEVHLQDDDVFEIFGDDDVYNDEEDEMIGKDQLERLGFKPNEGKYFRIHQMALRQNHKELEMAQDRMKRNNDDDDGSKSMRNKRLWDETNFDLEDPVPWQAGFVDKNGHLDNDNVYYLNEMAKDLIARKIDEKREEAEQILAVENVTVATEMYDYAGFKDEYQAEVKKMERQNDTLNFTDVKEDESIKDVLKEAVDFKTEAKNCTAEEAKGIGLSAWKCLLKDMKRPKSAAGGPAGLAKKIARIVLIWTCVYVAIAVPLWCQRGWCCCCCRCKFCRPREMLDESKRYFVTNPPGTLHQDDGEIVHYPPTVYEIYAEKQLEKALLRL